MNGLRRHLNAPNLLAVVVIFILLGTGSFAAAEGSIDVWPTSQPEETLEDAQPAVSEEEAEPADQATNEAAPQSPGADGYAAEDVDVEPTHPDAQDETAVEEPPAEPVQLDPPDRGQAAPAALENAAGDERSEKAETAEGPGGGGPPPWAPAHGWRCKSAGAAPGSAAFHACIDAAKG
ncbi:MAG TPA: hypothetical protein VKA89_03380 [Solirubrobacterales bacterium]|nr:hypothetical protein [Solirubrobacterales bacterium]